MSSLRQHFPPDLLALIFQPVLILVVALGPGLLLSAITGLRQPSAFGWIAAFYAATSTAILGIVLLFFAKLPQYRAGSFWRVGFRHLPPSHQHLYRFAFLLIVPSCLVLLVLLPIAACVR